MAHIVNTLQPHFTGHIGPVRFVNGHAECHDAELVEFFAGEPDHYAVTDADTPELKPAGDDEDHDDEE